MIIDMAKVVLDMRDRLMAAEEILLHHEGRISRLEDAVLGDRYGYVPPFRDKPSQEQHDARIAELELRLKVRRQNNCDTPMMVDKREWTS